MSDLSPDVIERARRGDDESWSCIVEETTSCLIHRIATIVRDPDEAWDVLQATFVDAFHKFSGFRGGDLEGWLFKIATYRALDSRRRSLRAQRTRVPIDDSDEVDAGPPWSGGTPQSSVDLTSEAERALWEACESLPRLHRAVFLYRTIHGLEYGEIARRMGGRTGTARMHYTRARRALRKALKNNPAVRALRSREES